MASRVAILITINTYGLRAQREKKMVLGWVADDLLQLLARSARKNGFAGGSWRFPGWVVVFPGVGHCGNPGGSWGGSLREPGWVAAGVPAGTERAAGAAGAAAENLPRFGLVSAGLRHHLSRLWQSPSRLGHRRRCHPPNFDP